MVHVEKAKLPAVYKSARAALEKCERIDECEDWKDKAAAMASYAKQAKDDSMLTMASRIKARAVKRCGELFKQIAPAKNHHDARTRGGATPSRIKAAKAAGLSRDEMKQAIRVANIPDDEFEAMVESDRPPTVTELASRGARRAQKDFAEVDSLFKRGLGDRTPEQVRAAARALGVIDSLYTTATETSAADAVRGMVGNQGNEQLPRIAVAVKWLERLTKEIEHGRR